MKTNPCEIASRNLFAEFRKHYNPYSNGDGIYVSAATTFDRLVPDTGKSATLFVLDFVRKNPNTTPSKIIAAYKSFKGKTISNNLFQNLRWSGLVTPRKYNLTKLGHKLLKYYNI